MADAIINSFFGDDSGPILGLSPTIRIWEVTAAGETLIIGDTCGTGVGSPAADGAMLENEDCGSPTAKDGFYRFVFTEALGYNQNSTYVVRVDGGIAVTGARDRYQTSRLSPADCINTQFIEDAVWDASAASHVGGSPQTMGEFQNNIEVIRTVDIPALFSLLDLVRKYNTNRTKIDTVAKTLTIYDDDCTTVLRVFSLLDSSGTPSVAEVCERTSIGGVGSPLIGPDGLPTCS